MAGGRLDASSLASFSENCYTSIRVIINTMIYNTKTASVTELRQNATQLIKEMQESHEPLFILQNSRQAGVLLDKQSYEALLEAYMDQRDAELAEEALANPSEKTYTLEDIEKMRSVKSKKKHV